MGNAKEEAEKAACEAVRISGNRAFGLTAGGSTVGFCTPDTNPFQAKWTREFERKRVWNEEDGKCGPVQWVTGDKTTTYTLAGSIYFQFIYTKYRNAPDRSNNRAYTFSFRMPMATGASAFETSVADEPSPELEGAFKEIADWINENIVKCGTAEDNSCNILSNFESKVNDLFTTVVDKTKNAASSNLLK